MHPSQHLYLLNSISKYVARSWQFEDRAIHVIHTSKRNAAKKLAHLLLVFIEVTRSCDLTYEMVAKKCAAKTKHLIVLPQKFNSDKKNIKKEKVNHEKFQWPKQ